MLSQRHPLLVIGLDGGTFNILEPLFAKGELPHLRRLCHAGLRAELLSTLPVATLPAWTSFLTAANPAGHGVTDIFMRRDDGYGLTPANGTKRTVPTFLARLSAQGYAVASLGVPGTYPPEPLSGICIAGFDAPGARGATAAAVWPPAFWPELQRLGGWRYATFNELRHGEGRMEQALAALHTDIAAKERVILDVYQRQAWDVFCVHLQASDTAAHHLWHTFDATSPRHLSGHADALPSVYRRLDTLIGRLLAVAPPATRVLVVSDHGMGGAGATAVHLNRWLHARGHLHFKRSAERYARQGVGKVLRRFVGSLAPGVLGAALRLCPDKLASALLDATRGTAIDFPETVAFSDELDYAPAIWINRAGRFPHGTVNAAHATELIDVLRRDLLDLRDTDGSALIHAVHRRHDLPAGPHSDALPDLLIEPAWPRGFRPSFLGSAGPGAAVRRLSESEFAAPKGAGMPGVHQRAGVFMACGPGIPTRALPPLHIAEAGALVYALLGAALPHDLEVMPPAELVTLLGAELKQSWHADVQAADPYTVAETAELTQRLQDLGYLDG